MGRPDGFMVYHRKDPGYRPKEERIKDFRAVDKQLTHDEIQIQAARCMDCGTPFCHAYGCPLANVIPEFNESVYRGHWEGALKILLSTNNFPEFTGRICPAPCETACVAGINVDPVMIRHIELSIIEKGFESGFLLKDPPRYRSDKRVAVVGSGPAGLAAADTLNRVGYQVTVFDEARYPGGILRYGIPDFKLEKWVVERRISLMEAQGVRFEMGVRVGTDISYRYLRDRFQALCLACGAREPRDLAVPGRELSGIHFALEYLTGQNKRIQGENLKPSEEIEAKGKSVLVIGGGDTGSDCLGTAIRQGAKQVFQFEILPKPPEKRSPLTPWPEWPIMLRQSHAHKEGGEFYWSVMTKAFEGKDNRVKKVKAVEVEWKPKREGDPLVPVEQPGTEFELEVDLVLLAMGFLGPEKGGLAEVLDFEKDSRNNIKGNDENMTNIPGVFVAGDMRQGQSLVVRAIADGRKAARGIIRWLRA
jgi:glutamate synthase (NADPH/NADH) small chain